jgi:hypothetical protein
MTSTMYVNGKGAQPSHSPVTAKGNGIAGPVVRPAPVKARKFGWVKRHLGDIGVQRRPQSTKILRQPEYAAID